MRTLARIFIGFSMTGALAAGSAAAADAPATQPAAAPATAPAKAAIGAPAPAWELRASDGKTYKLSDFKDKTVVLEWYNKDCPACRKVLPLAKETSEKYAKKGVTWLGIESTAARKSEENVEHVRKVNMPHPILEDFDGVVGRSYDAKRTPTMYIIHKGVLVYTGALVEDGGTRNYVAEALDAIGEGKPVPVASTKAYG